MTKTLATLTLATLGGVAAAQSFPIAGNFILSPKTGKTFAALEMDDPRGYISQLPIPFTRSRVDLTPFTYLGVQIAGDNSGTAGFGLKFKKDSWNIGGTYGLVAGDKSPHFGFSLGYEFALTQRKAGPAASVHSFTIH